MIQRTSWTPVEFLFNDGSLMGDDRLEQLLHVVACYEIAGVRVYGICPDAGCGNSSMFSKICVAANFSTQDG
jgi:hypothetical protein